MKDKYWDERFADYSDFEPVLVQTLNDLEGMMIDASKISEIEEKTFKDI